MSTPATRLDPLDVLLLVSVELPLIAALLSWRLSALMTVVPLDAALGRFHGPVFGCVGLLALSLGLRMAFRGHPLRNLVRVGLLLIFAVNLILEMALTAFFEQNRAVLDGPILVYTAKNLPALLAVFAAFTRPLAWLLALLAVVLPVGLMTLADRRYTAPGPRGRFWIPCCIGLVLLGLSTLAPTGGPLPRSLGRSVLANAAISLIREHQEPLLDGVAPRPPSLAPRSPQRPNLVIIGLESVSAAATTLHDPSLGTTPFLASLAPKALVVDRAYSNVGHTTKTWVAMLCGIQPWLGIDLVEAEPQGIPVPCLPALLRPLGYRSLFLSSSKRDLENQTGLLKNLGFDEVQTLEDLDTTGFQAANYFSHEDWVMLPPSQAWLQQQQGPFLAFYMTGTAHHDYQVPSRFPLQDFHPDEQTNRYLNAVYYTDRFVEALLAQYEALSLLDNTVFILLGDHGEGLDDPLRAYHNACVFDECMRIPFVVLAPGRVPAQHVSEGDQLQVLPTALDAIGVDTVELSAPSLLRPHEPRTLFQSCWYTRACIASVEAGWKLIHTFDERPDALYDLRNDPGERHDLASRFPDRVQHRREGLLHWYRSTKGSYRATLEAR